jgi:hypothetical protein
VFFQPAIKVIATYRGANNWLKVGFSILLCLCIYSVVYYNVLFFFLGLPKLPKESVVIPLWLLFVMGQKLLQRACAFQFTHPSLQFSFLKYRCFLSVTQTDVRSGVVTTFAHLLKPELPRTIVRSF